MVNFNERWIFKEDFMHYTGDIYRPHVEATTPMLEVTAGCSYNSCSFCTMYKKIPFSVTPKNILKADLEELKNTSKYPIRRLLLLSGDPFCLSTHELMELATLIRSYLPDLKTITCYASILNIMNKSIEELRELESYGYRELHIGFESGYEKALKILNTGFEVQDIYQSLEKLQEANIEYHAIIMAGAAGKGTYKENVKETIKVLEFYPPITLSAYPTLIYEGTPLADLVKKNKYEESSQKEKILGQIQLLKEANLPDTCFYSGNFVFHLLPATAFFKDKNKLISEFENYLKNADPEILNSP